MAFAFVINDMEEINTFSYDTCVKTIPWLSAQLRDVFGRYDGGIHADRLAKEMRGLDRMGIGGDMRGGARRILRQYYRMYCEKEIANDSWYRDLQASIARDREGAKT